MLRRREREAVGTKCKAQELAGEVVGDRKIAGEYALAPGERDVGGKHQVQMIGVFAMKRDGFVCTAVRSQKLRCDSG